MKYVSQNAENIQRFVQPGTYQLTVVEATETVSQSGSEMIKLRLEVEGHGVTLFDYLVASPNSFWKIDTFRKAIGERVVEGEEVELVASQLEGRQGSARLRVEEYQGKKNNKVEAWIVASTASHQSQPKTAAGAPQETNEPF